MKFKDGAEVDMNSSQLCRFIRSVIDWIRSHDRQRYKGWPDAVKRAEETLKTKGIEFVRIEDTTRRDNIIYKGVGNLDASELAFLENSLLHEWLEALSVDTARELAELAKGSVLRSSMTNKKLLGLWADMLDLPGQTPTQGRLEQLSGDYFIFRRIFARPLLVVSHMKIVYQGPFLPASFTTEGFPGGATYETSRTVQGIIYDAPGTKNLIFAIGKLDASSEIRASILEVTPKVVKDSRKFGNDLMAVRLGVGRETGNPIAYRIWCSRLEGQPPAGGWGRIARQYKVINAGHEDIDLLPPAEFEEEFESLTEATPLRYFEKVAPGFHYILRWLSNQVNTTLRKDGDP